MGILDSVSRLSLTTDDILTASNRTIADVGPFTDAVLGKHHITDIIRDAEEGEQTLFTHRSADVGGVKGPVDPKPVAVGAGGMVGAGVGTGVKDKEQDVDVLLNAALKLVETYGSMPRAKSHIEDMLDRASEARSRISLLEDELEELKNAEPASTEPDMPSLKDEERAVVKMEAQLNAARRRRDALREQIAQKQRARTNAQSHTNVISTPTAVARTRTRPGGGKIRNPFLARITSSLADKDPDATTNLSIHLAADSASESFLVDQQPPQWADDSMMSRSESVDPGVESIWDGRGEAGGGEDEEEEDGEAEGTVVLAIPPVVALSPPTSPVRTAPVLRSSIAPTPAPVRPPVAAAPPPPIVEPPPAKPPPEPKPKADAPVAKPQQIQVTPETQANTALIWTTVGKVLEPSSNYDPPGPDVLETASILQSLSSQSVASSDPQPVLTATLLLYLLQNGPSPLPAIRTALADKEKDSESASGLGIKALYACVAKKLLKIDRKGREATVRFE
ncbi:hypothetical protein RSOLAG22IIIB_12021 [Rhizoctonia solani]|uniref:Uncharacterized protein n=1 Tax=Rhizoctonia solani TaxID=456999 RepID=A0A0K6GBG4_9AGAM|nr:hypothetical protein RSOLAG22IIIB_12021 [Rhizoctonia solani]